MASSGMKRRVALARTEVSEELSSSFIRVTKIGELETTLAVTSNSRKLRRNTKSCITNTANKDVVEWCLLGCYAVLLL
jgi:hypothetical protein